ncbi:MAG: hypothetical protein H8K08_07235 [Nitrospira sp.]|nr:hypothetical protein [Nitrospira sp.]
MESDTIQNRPSIQGLRTEAYRLAKGCRERASRPGATPIDKNLAEAATLLITLAERKVEVVPASWAKAQVREFERWAAQRLRTLAAHELVAIRNGSTASHALADKALSDVRNEQALLSERLKRKEWDVWDWAVDELTALNAGLTVDSGLQGEG